MSTLRIFTFCLLLLTLMSEMPAAAAAVTARDDTGQVVSLAQHARRVVSLAPSTTEMLFALGAGSLLVGVSSYDDYPAAAKKLPKMGAFSGPDLERVIAAKPDLIVAAHGNPLDMIRRLRNRKYPVYVTHPTTVNGVMKNLRDLGHLTGRDTPARRLVNDLQSRLRRVAQRVDARAPVKTLVVIWDEPLTIAGSKSFIQDVLRLAGGSNAASGLSATYPTLDPEQTVRLDPQVILFPVGGDAERLQRLKGRPGFRQTRAAKTDRFHSMNPDWLMRPGPRIVAGVEALARLLHPEADVRKE